MIKIFHFIGTLILLFVNTIATAQLDDTLEHKHTPASHFIKPLVLPTVCIGYGLVALGNHELQNINHNIKQNIQKNYPNFSTSIDNYLQFTPVVAVYVLNGVGIHGKNNFRDRTMMYGISTLIITATNFSLKHITQEQRPDGSSFLSFPSGHTATAFAAAEFLHQEYKDISVWYGIAGYTAAVATGALRMYNNRHWLSDVVAGAGIGILATKASYWMYPAIKKIFFKNKAMHTMATPYYNGNAGGILLTYGF